jgi:hypothetical protein
MGTETPAYPFIDPDEWDRHAVKIGLMTEDERIRRAYQRILNEAIRNHPWRR